MNNAGEAVSGIVSSRRQTQPMYFGKLERLLAGSFYGDTAGFNQRCRILQITMAAMTAAISVTTPVTRAWRIF
jgi:hypothetical protein